MIFSFIFSILFSSVFILLFIPNNKINTIRFISLLSSGIVLILSSSFLVTFNCNNYYFQEIVTYTFGFDYLNLYFSLGLDGISLFFFILSSLLIFLCILFDFN